MEEMSAQQSESNYKQFIIKLSNKQHSKLKMLSSHYNISMQKLIQYIIEQKLDSAKSFFDELTDIKDKHNFFNN